MFRTHLVNVEKQEVLPPMEIHAQTGTSVNGLKRTVINELGLTASEAELIMIVQHSGRFTTIVGDEHPLALYDFKKKIVDVIPSLLSVLIILFLL